VPTRAIETRQSGLDRHSLRQSSVSRAVPPRPSNTRHDRTRWHLIYLPAKAHVETPSVGAGISSGGGMKKSEKCRFNLALFSDRVRKTRRSAGLDEAEQLRHALALGGLQTGGSAPPSIGIDVCSESLSVLGSMRVSSRTGWSNAVAPWAAIGRDASQASPGQPVRRAASHLIHAPWFMEAGMRRRLATQAGRNLPGESREERHAFRVPRGRNFSLADAHIREYFCIGFYPPTEWIQSALKEKKEEEEKHCGDGVHLSLEA